MTELYSITELSPGHWELRKIDQALGHATGPARIVYKHTNGKLYCDPATCPGAKYESGRRPHTKHVDAVEQWLAQQQQQKQEEANGRDSNDVPTQHEEH
jgi:hypothetical protein